MRPALKTNGARGPRWFCYWRHCLHASTRIYTPLHDRGEGYSAAPTQPLARLRNAALGRIQIGQGGRLRHMAPVLLTTPIHYQMCSYQRFIH